MFSNFQKLLLCCRVSAVHIHQLIIYYPFILVHDVMKEVTVTPIGKNESP